MERALAWVELEVEAGILGLALVWLEWVELEGSVGDEVEQGQEKESPRESGFAKERVEELAWAEALTGSGTIESAVELVSEALGIEAPLPPPRLGSAVVGQRLAVGGQRLAAVELRLAQVGTMESA